MSHESGKCKMHKIERIVKVNDCIWIRVITISRWWSFSE